MGPRRKKQPSKTWPKLNTGHSVKHKDTALKKNNQLIQKSMQTLLSQLPTVSVKLTRLSENVIKHYENTKSQPLIKNRMLPNLSTQAMPNQLSAPSVRLSPLNIKSEPCVNGSIPVKEKQPVFSCMFCDYTSADRTILSLHVTEVHKCLQVFSCTDCHYQTNTKEHFANHLALHTVSVGQSEGEKSVRDFENSEGDAHIYNDKDESFNSGDETLVGERLFDNNFSDSAVSLVNTITSIESADTNLLGQDARNFAMETENIDDTEISLENLLEIKTEFDFETFASFKEALKQTPKLIKHMSNNAFSNESEFPCFKCSYTSRTFKYFRDHFNEHAGLTPYSCKHCDAKFCAASKLNSHIHRSHRDSTFACDQCSFTATRERSLKMHNLAKHPTEEDFTFECPLCPKKFSMQRRLKAHMLANHSDKKKFECDFCGYSTNYKESFTSHMNTHTGRVYACPACKESYQTLKRLRTHQRSHAEMFCNQCSFYTSCNKDLSKHKAQHFEEKPQKCTHCNFRTTNQAVLLDHEHRHKYNKFENNIGTSKVLLANTEREPTAVENFKGQQDNMISKENEAKSEFEERGDEEFFADGEITEATERCIELELRRADLITPSTQLEIRCSSSQENKSEQNEEKIDEVVTGGSNKNEEQLQALASETALMRNSKATVKEKENASIKVKKKADSKNLLKVNAHFETFSSFVEALKQAPSLIKLQPSSAFPMEKEFACWKCNYEVSSFKVFRKHFLGHIGFTSLSCKLCDAKFPNHSSLCAHIDLKHKSKISLFSCDQCIFSTKNRLSLKEHILRKHPSEEDFKFQCPECIQKFTLKKSLKKHVQRTHSDQKKYQCDQCSYASNYRELLEVHMSQHTGLKFLCAVCRKSYGTKRRLSVHIKTHKDRFFCDRCTFSTSLAANLKRHQLVHSERKPYKCPYCNFRTKTNSWLQAHKKRHRDSKGNFRRVQFQRRENKSDQSLDLDTTGDKGLLREKNDCFDTSLPVQVLTSKTIAESIMPSAEIVLRIKNECNAFSEFREILKQYPKLIQAFPKSAFNNDQEFSCFKCDYFSRTFKYFKEHFFEHADLTPYTCKYCGKKFSSFYLKYKHIYTTHETEFYNCNICTFSTKRLMVLQRHMQYNHGKEEDMFQCPHCPSKFVTQYQCNNHVLSNHKELQKYHCDHCPYATDNPVSLEKHVKRHLPKPKEYLSFEAFKAVLAENPEMIQSVRPSSFRDEKQFACFKCKYVTPSFKYFKQHFNEHAGLTPYVCKHCNTRFTRASQMYVHIKNSHEALPCYCIHCPFSTKSEHDLKRHTLSKHPTAEDFKFLCPHCPEKFALGRNLKSHILRKHSVEKRYTCDLCEYSTNDRDSMVTHKNKHAGQIFLCTACGASFYCEKTLHIHYKSSHTGTYYCKQCSYSSTSEQNLKRHLTTHSDERPLQCPHCSFRAKTPSVLHLHKRQHDPAELKYPCSTCGKKFITKAAVRGHAESHISQVFECTICDYICRSRGNHRRHLRTHNPDTDFNCEMCDKRFIKQKHLDNHIKKAHC